MIRRGCRLILLMVPCVALLPIALTVLIVKMVVRGVARVRVLRTGRAFALLWEA